MNYLRELWSGDVCLYPTHVKYRNIDVLYFQQIDWFNEAIKILIIDNKLSTWNRFSHIFDFIFNPKKKTKYFNFWKNENQLSKNWESWSRENLMINSNLLSEFLSFRQTNRYVGNRTRFMFKSLCSTCVRQRKQNKNRFQSSLHLHYLLLYFVSYYVFKIKKKDVHIYHDTGSG